MRKNYLKAFGVISPGDLLAFMVNEDWLARGLGEHDEERRRKRQSRYLKKDGWVLLTRQKLEFEFGLDDCQQKRVINKLVKVGIVKVKMVGNPAKRHFKLDEEATERFIVNACSGGAKTPHLGGAETPHLLSKISIENRDVPADAGRGANGGRDMPLEGINLPERKPGRVEVQEVDKLRAQFLHDGLRHRGIGLARSWSKSAWAREFATLRVAHDTFDIDKLLSWYNTHIGEDYVPVAHSAKAFRLKFDAIVEAKKRADRDNPQVEITDLGRQVGTSLRHLRWPKGTEADLLTAVQLTLDTYRAFLQRLGKVASRPEHVRGKKGLTRDRVRDLADYLSGVLSSPATFTANWIKDVHQKAVYAKQAHGSWKGSLVKSALRSVDDKDFKALVEGAAGRYGAGESTLAKLWEEIK